MIPKYNRSLCFSRPLILVVLAVALIGCDRAPSGAGVYVNQTKPQEVTELKKDGTFLINQSSATYRGTYTIEGHNITLKVTSGEQLKGRIEKGTITDNEGQRWVKP